MSTAIAAREPRRIRPWLRRGPLFSLREEIDDLFSNFLSEASDSWPNGSALPPLDLTETDSSVEVRLDVPGIKPGELDIQLTGNTLSISGERKEEFEDKGRTVYRSERRIGSFSRSITLPCAVKEDHVDAQYRDGVLTITLQKTEESKTRKIKIRT
ncbi:MAG TPA: Hsp20/alpha crystallin family protein [Pirellulales bacterium]|nr:Hsp20/alpha crystallin family protein [Pirellulales bacterium]